VSPGQRTLESSRCATEVSKVRSLQGNKASKRRGARHANGLLGDADLQADVGFARRIRARRRRDVEDVAGTVLFVSAKTIEIHLGNVYRKLGVRSRTDLARYFMQR
jgi:hypothetical protein